MSVAAQNVPIQYAGNGSTTTFNFPYRFFANTDLVVVLTSAGNDTPQVLGSDYTISGANVVFSTAPASGVTVTIYSSVPATQDADYISQDNFPAETHETALDRLTVMVQQLRAQVARCLRLPLTSSVAGELSLSARSEKLLSFDGQGKPDLEFEADALRTLLLANPVGALSSVTDYGSISDEVVYSVDYGSIT